MAIKFLLRFNGRSTGGLMQFQPAQPQYATLPAGLAALARTTAPTTSATAASAEVASTTAMSAALYLRAGLVNVQIATAKIHSIQCGYGSFGLTCIGHLHERKTSRSARITIRHQADTFHGPVLLKKRADGIFSRAEVQVAYKNLFHVISSVFESGHDSAQVSARFCGAIKFAYMIADFGTPCRSKYGNLRLRKWL
jgi:hypothetical protein